MNTNNDNIDEGILRKPILVPAFELADSALLSETTRVELHKYRAYQRTDQQEAREALVSIDESDGGALRRFERERFYQSQPYKSLISRYDVLVTDSEIGGVYTEIFTPANGIAQKNENRVLINLHGGAFQYGSRTASHLESIPVAALGEVKVVSVDYRMAPEYRFPAATKDVVAVYKALLQSYKPENIGLYGASAGAQLCAQTLVSLQEDGIVLPGAVGMIAGGATLKTGDSLAIVGAILQGSTGGEMQNVSQPLYFEGSDLTSPQVTPAKSGTFMSNFPPSLLISSTRDFSLSVVVSSHTQLIKLGVEANLHVWEGLDHVFHYNPDLPESQELNEVIIKFFNKYLGR